MVLLAATPAACLEVSMPDTWIVRHGAMRFLGEFDPEGASYSRGQEVVVRTERGQEVGTVLAPASLEALALLSEPTHGRILRTLSDHDREERQRLKEMEEHELETCERFVATRRLQMELVD